MFLGFIIVCGSLMFVNFLDASYPEIVIPKNLL